MSDRIPNGIRGVSDRRSIPRVGKIRLGIRVPNRSGRGDHPEQTDYFVVPESLQELLGEKPQSIPIWFPSDDPADFAEHALKLYARSGLRCRGNGELADALVHVPLFEKWQRDQGEPGREMWASPSPVERGQRGPEWRRIPCLGAGYDGEPPCPMFGPTNEGGGGCTPVMHLQFVVRGWHGLGVWQIDTGSVANIERVLSFVDLLKATTGGRAAWIPLTLTLEPVQMRGTTKYLLRLNFDGDPRELMALRGPEAGARQLLPAPEEEAEPPEVIDGDDPRALDAERPDFIEAEPECPEPVSEPAEAPAIPPPSDDDMDRAYGLVQWAIETLGLPDEAMVLSVLGVRGLDGIAAMGVGEAQAKLERAREESVVVPAPDPAAQPELALPQHALPDSEALAAMFPWLEEFAPLAKVKGVKTEHLAAALKLDAGPTAPKHLDVLRAADAWLKEDGRTVEALAEEAGAEVPFP